MFAEDDRHEFPCISFKLKPGMTDPQPYFSVFRGSKEIASVFIDASQDGQEHIDSGNYLRYYQLCACSDVQVEQRLQ